MTAALQRYLSTGVLTIWGVTFLYMFHSGRVVNTLHPTFRIGLVLAGVALLLMAAGMLFLPRPASAGDAGKPLWGRLLVAAVLTVPLLIVVRASPDQFDGTFVRNRGFVEKVSDLPNYQPPYQEPALPTEDGKPAAAAPSATPADQLAPYLKRNADGNVVVQTVDMVYASEVPSMREDLENKKVELIGQFLPARSNNAHGDRFDLVRMVMSCCAADARPVATMVQGHVPDKAAEMSWVKVVGRATFPLEGGRRIPVVVAESVTPCDPPEETFIY